MISLFKVLMSPEIGPAITEVLNSGYIGQGAQVEKFEASLAQMFQIPQERVVTTNSGTSAIDLAIQLIGARNGDEIIVTPMTCAATIVPLIHRGITPVWADVDPRTGNLDPLDVARKRTKKTKAILAVNWGGEPCDYQRLGALGLPVIEDAAHCFLPKTGGDYVCFSFQAIKFLTTGDGGTLLVPAGEEDRARKLRWFGLDRTKETAFRCSQSIEEAGFKYHMNDIAATIGLTNLAGARNAVHIHQRNAYHLSRVLTTNAKISTNSPTGYSSYWLYTLIVDERDRLRRYLATHGVASSPVHRRNDTQPAFAKAAKRIYSLPGVDEFASSNLSIPIGWWVSLNELDNIVTLLERWQ
jgi:dTDP-4-amino-4,6-dideoxygalactose transaminase